MRVLNEQELNEKNETNKKNPIANGMGLLAAITILGGIILSGFACNFIPIAAGVVAAIFIAGFAEIINLLQNLSNKADVIIENLSALNSKDTDNSQ